MPNENDVKLSNFKQYRHKVMLAEIATKSSQSMWIIKKPLKLNLQWKLAKRYIIMINFNVKDCI